MFGHGITYMGKRAVAAQTHILGGVRTLYLGSEERFVHLLVRHAEEMLNSARSFRVEFPDAEGLAFARLALTNQHNLHYLDKTDIPLEEISDVALQCQHVINWPPVQPLVDP